MNGVRFYRRRHRAGGTATSGPLLLALGELEGWTAEERVLRLLNLSTGREVTERLFASEQGSYVEVNAGDYESGGSGMSSLNRALWSARSQRGKHERALERLDVLEGKICGAVAGLQLEGVSA